MLFTLASLAFAGTLHLQSESPVSYRLDGNMVAFIVTHATIDDVPYGHHQIEVVDAVGTVLAQADLLMDNVPMFFEYGDHRLDRLDPTKMSFEDLGLENPALDAAEFLDLKRSLTIKKDKKKIKILQSAANKYWFDMRHVNELLGAFDSLSGRVAAAVLLAPKTVDPQRFEAISHHFEQGEYMDRAKRAFVSELGGTED
jgi:hypothetical protein